jgi:anhydro-N-acetylmuramic acid kinase
MTGTSCDGLDAACLELDSVGWRPLWQESRPYPASLRRRVIAIQKPGSRVSLLELLELNRDLGEWYASTLAALVRSKRPAPDVIANHGQTIAHFPDEGVTLQAGDPARIAVTTGLTVVSNFREGDLAAGGQGAPLVPLYHRMLADRLQGGGVAIHNLGGISNLTYIDPAGAVLAFDTGPGNAWIDAAAERASGKKMDRGGKLAFAGEIDPAAMRKLLKHPFLAKKPPKSTGRDDFPIELFFSSCRARGADLVATATAYTIETIARSYERWILDRGLPLRAIYLCGGGASNPAIVESLRSRLDGVEVGTLEDAGLDPRYVEAQSFALFGLLCLAGKPIGGPWTGARGYGPAGHIVPGRNWAEVVKQAAKLAE